MLTTISVRGAREHNLKDVDIDIPRDTLTVITGLSGSGKSSLAFDTIYAEGQRRYVESLSAYARQFLELHRRNRMSIMIDGLSAGDRHRSRRRSDSQSALDGGDRRPRFTIIMRLLCGLAVGTALLR